MTSDLRPAVGVWRDAAYQYGGMSIEGGEGEYLAAAVIEADREAVRAEQAAEIERLRQRLEIDPSHSMDGIYARDETIRGLDAELAKYKALAETLAGALEAFAEEWDEREFLAQRHWSFYREASKAIAEYKEARDAS